MRRPDVVYELPPSRRHVVAPLFEGVWIDRALIDSVLEGTEPARIFADDPARPETALLCCEAQGDYVLAGSAGRPPGGPLRQFVRDLPREAGVFDRPHFAFFMPQPAWGDALREDFAGRIPVFPTRSFRYAGARIDPVPRWQERLALPGVAVWRIDADLLRGLDAGELRMGKAFTVRGQEGGEIGREELAEIGRDRFGFCAVVDAEIASVGAAFRVSSRYASVAVDTSRPFRRRGLATLACAALLEECLRRGLTPLWNCLASNVASAATALKLGMEEGPPQCESQWRPGWTEVQTTTGRWRRDDGAPSGAPGPAPSVVVWRRTLSPRRA
jgi:RimJ/RimL family protein N-acetyltransferase